jgi:hypothetical protein
MDISHPQKMSRCIQGFHAPALHETPQKRSWISTFRWIGLISCLSKQKKAKERRTIGWQTGRRVAGQMWLFEEIIKLIVGKCLCTVRTRFRLIAEDGRMKGFFVHLYQREKFGATIPTSKHQLRHSFAITRISYFNIKLSTPIE